MWIADLWMGIFLNKINIVKWMKNRSYSPPMRVIVGNELLMPSIRHQPFSVGIIPFSFSFRKSYGKLSLFFSSSFWFLVFKVLLASLSNCRIWLCLCLSPLRNCSALSLTWLLLPSLIKSNHFLKPLFLKGSIFGDFQFFGTWKDASLTYLLSSA